MPRGGQRRRAPLQRRGHIVQPFIVAVHRDGVLSARVTIEAAVGQPVVKQPVGLIKTELVEVAGDVALPLHPA